MLQGPCTLAFTDIRAGRTTALGGIFLTLILGESIDAVAWERVLAIAALVHLDASQSLLLTLTDDPNAVHAGDTADRAGGPRDAVGNLSHILTDFLRKVFQALRSANLTSQKGGRRTGNRVTGVPR